MTQTAKKTRSKKSKSVYAPGPKEQKIERHTLAVLVRNEPGILAKVVGLISGRGYNIESLTVAETDHFGHLSRITIVVAGTPAVIEQIKAQLERLVPVQGVRDMTTFGPFVERELALVKMEVNDKNREEILGIVDEFRARTLDSTAEFFIFEITGTARRIDNFIEAMLPLGLLNVTRTGVTAISKGIDTIEE